MSEQVGDGYKHLFQEKPFVETGQQMCNRHRTVNAVL